MLLLFLLLFVASAFAVRSWNGNITTPCGSCQVQGGQLDLLFWPKTDAPGIAQITQAVNTNGFTLVSPSVYIAFSTINAFNDCGDIGTLNKVPTLAFQEYEISTVPAYSWNGTTQPLLHYGTEAAWVPATWSDLSDCYSITTSWWQLPNEYERYSDFSLAPTIDGFVANHYTVSYNPCLPSIYIPSSKLILTNLVNSQLTSCVGNFGFFDPPSAISAVNGLLVDSPLTNGVPSAAQQITTSNAAPAAAPTPITASSTTTSAVVGPSSTQLPAVHSAANSSPTPNDPTVVNNPSPVTGASTPTVIANTVEPTSTAVAADPALPSIAAQNPSLAGNTPVANPATPITDAVLPSSVTPTYIVGSSQSLVAGAAPVIVSGTAVSLQAGGSSVVVGGAPVAGGTILTGGSTIALSAYLGQPTQAATVVIGGTTQALSEFAIASTPAPTQAVTYVVASQSLVAGGAPITISGTAVSLQSGGSSVVVGSSTVALSVFLGVPTQEATVIIGGTTQVLSAFTTPAPVAKVIIGGLTQDLSAYLAEVTGTADLVAGGTTQQLSVLHGISGDVSIVVGGKTLAAAAFLATVTGSPSVVVGGTTYALGAYLGEVTSAASVVVGSHTLTLSSGSEPGMAGIIATLGGFPPDPPKSTNSYVQYEGGAGGYNGTMFLGGSSPRDKSTWLLGLMVSLGVLVVILL